MQREWVVGGGLTARSRSCPAPSSPELSASHWNHGSFPRPLARVMRGWQEGACRLLRTALVAHQASARRRQRQQTTAAAALQARVLMNCLWVTLAAHSQRLLLMMAGRMVQDVRPSLRVAREALSTRGGFRQKVGHRSLAARRRGCFGARESI